MRVLFPCPVDVWRSSWRGDTLISSFIYNHFLSESFDFLYPQAPPQFHLLHKAFLGICLSTFLYGPLFVISLFLKCCIWNVGETWDGPKWYTDKHFNSFSFMLFIRENLTNTLNLWFTNIVYAKAKFICQLKILNKRQ